MGEQPKGPFCQSCSMPLEKPDDFGTGAEGFRVNDYCHYCFDKSAFTVLQVAHGIGCVAANRK
jgi:hypothetical protein